MNDESLNRNIEFIIQQQAAFNAKMDKLQEKKNSTDPTVNALSEIGLLLSKQTGKLGRYIGYVGTRVDSLDLRSDRHDEQLETHSVTLDQLMAGYDEIQKRIAALEQNGSK